MAMTQHLYDTAKSILLSNLDYSYLEIGSWDGSGITDLAVNFPNQFFFSIDPFIEDGDVRSGYTKGEKMLSVKDKFLKNTKNIKNIINFEISSKDFLNRIHDYKLVSQINNVGFILIDGNHSYEYVETDIKIAVEILNGRVGYILFDDVFNVPDVERAVSEIFVLNYSKNIEIGRKQTIGNCWAYTIASTIGDILCIKYNLTPVYPRIHHTF